MPKTSENTFVSSDIECQIYFDIKNYNFSGGNIIFMQFLENSSKNRLAPPSRKYWIYHCFNFPLDFAQHLENNSWLEFGVNLNSGSTRNIPKHVEPFEFRRFKETVNAMRSVSFLTRSQKQWLLWLWCVARSNQSIMYVNWHGCPRMRNH